MYATVTINPEYASETAVDVYTQVWDARNQRVIEDEYRLACWGGSNLMTGEPFIVFTPPDGIPKYSVKQEEFYKTFMLAAHVHFMLTGEVRYHPSKPHDSYKVLFPDYSMSRTLPKFKVM